MAFRTLVPLLQILNDFSEVLISDDKYDIGEFSSPSHQSMIHHYQWGTVLKGLTDTAIQLITFSSRMLQSQESQAQSLSAIRDMMEEAEYQRNQDKVQRVQLMLQYWNFLKNPAPNDPNDPNEVPQGPYYSVHQGTTIDWNNAVYKGDLRNIISNKDFQDAARYEYYRRQQVRQVQQYQQQQQQHRAFVSPRALPERLPKPPKAPRLI